MIIFSIELSTVKASAAICENELVLAEVSWTEPQARHQRLFDETPKLLKQAGMDWPQIDLFAVGRGPGAFSGIRIGLMAAQMFAKPLSKPVVAVSSGEALAEEMGNWGDGMMGSKPPVIVCGDARRGMFWHGVHENGAMGGWKICRAEDWPQVVPAGAVIVTSQWERVESLRSNSPANCRWLEGDHFPTARAVARLALARVRQSDAGIPARTARGADEPLVPVYLHPPV